MKVSEIMTTRVVSVEPGATVKDAAVLMNKHNIGSVPVVENGSIKGIVTDRDIVLRCVSAGRDPGTLHVSDICSNGAVSVQPGQSVSEALHLMSTEQVRRLPVTEKGKLLGMVSLADIARERSGMELSQTISEISMPS